MARKDCIDEMNPKDTAHQTLRVLVRVEHLLFLINQKLERVAVAQDLQKEEACQESDDRQLEIR